MMLDLKLDRPATEPRDAATVILVRPNPSHGLDVFCVERSQGSRFLGGAIVFPGGKLEPADGDETWSSLSTEPRTPTPPPKERFARDAAHLRALAIAACRETIEEAALVLARPSAQEDAPRTISDEDARALSSRMKTEPTALRDWLRERGLLLHLTALFPLARWVTPEAESRRFDARFFLAVAPEGQHGAHDETETSASFWASPSDVLHRFNQGEIQLAPPTHRTLMLLAECTDIDAALARATTSCLEPICPRLVRHAENDASAETLALTLPGDPEHHEREVRVPGPSRYVLRGERWLPESLPR
jgi:8-oxo-dGTP pyrophosphatase MutT (NUDIX family)